MASMWMLFMYLSIYNIMILANSKLDENAKKHTDLLKWFWATVYSKFSMETLRQLKHMEIMVQDYQSINYSLPNLLTS